MTVNGCSVVDISFHLYPWGQFSMHRIHTNEKIKPGIYRMVVEAPYAAEHRRAGQLILIRISDGGKGLPLTIVDASPREGTITLVYNITDTITSRLSRLQKNDIVHAIAGPLGQPIETGEYGTVVCISGGMGAASLVSIVRAMKKKGNHVITINGARDSGLLILEDELSLYSDEIIICTEDGSSGRGGLATDALLETLRRQTVKRVVTIGPLAMMRAVTDMTRPLSIPTFVSLDSILVSGKGECRECRVTIGKKTCLTCIDGPVFDGHKIDFDDLIKRRKENAAGQNDRMDISCPLDNAKDNDIY